MLYSTVKFDVVTIYIERNAVSEIFQKLVNHGIYIKFQFLNLRGMKLFHSQEMLLVLKLLKNFLSKSKSIVVYCYIYIQSNMLSLHLKISFRIKIKIVGKCYISFIVIYPIRCCQKSKEIFNFPKNYTLLNIC